MMQMCMNMVNGSRLASTANDMFQSAQRHHAAEIPQMNISIDSYQTGSNKTKNASNKETSDFINFMNM